MHYIHSSMRANSQICMIVYSADAVQTARKSVTLPAAGVKPAPAACATVHPYTTPAFSSTMQCYIACNKQHICDATQTISNAVMQNCYRCCMQLCKYHC